MNKARRKRIDEAIAILEEVKEAELLAFDNLPESLQGSQRGEDMEEAASELDEAISSAQAARDK